MTLIAGVIACVLLFQGGHYVILVATIIAIALERLTKYIMQARYNIARSHGADHDIAIRDIPNSVAHMNMALTAGILASLVAAFML